MPKNPMLRLAIMVVVAAWLIYDMSTATEAPGQGLMILQYVLLGCLLLGIAGTAYAAMTAGKE